MVGGAAVGGVMVCDTMVWQRTDKLPQQQIEARIGACTVDGGGSIDANEH